MGDDICHQAIEQGSIKVILPSGQHVIIIDILHVPELARNLLSLSQILEKGSNFIFTKGLCTIESFTPSGHKITTEFLQQGRLFPIQLVILNQCETTNASYSLITNSNEPLRLHYQLCHLNKSHIIMMQKHGLAFGLPNCKMQELPFCEGCVFGKHHIQPFP